jgi:hypothetical protein
MTDQNSAAPDQNSTVEMQYRPEEVQQEFSIKSAQYYERLKFLGMKAHKDKEGKAYLDNSQFQKMKRLDHHIRETGGMDGFIDSEMGELAVSSHTNLVEVDDRRLATPISQPEQPTIENDLGKQIFRAAAELKASELAMMPQVIREVANRMTKDDLPEDLKQKIEQTEEATRPNFHPGAIADNLIQQFRQSCEQLA